MATAARSGLDGEVRRVDWTDWRAGGDYRYATAAAPELGAAPSIFGLVQVGDELYSATRGPVGDEGWARLDEEPTVRIPVSLELAEIAAGRIPPWADVAGGADVAREVGAGGEVSWTMLAAFGDATLVQAWVIDAGGVLRAYSVATSTGTAIQGDTTGVDYGFSPVPGGPISPPPLGAPLDLAELGVPADVLLVDLAEAGR